MLDHKPLVSIENLRVSFETDGGAVLGVRALNFTISAGECLCVVGESGSGKSVSALSLMRLVEYGGGEISSGRLIFESEDGRQIDLAQTPTSAMRDIRGNQIGMVFQEPMTALNPVLTIGAQLSEGMIRHLGLSRSQARSRAVELLKQVRIPEPERRLDQYPHELSGGMRQRVVIAMAIACKPRLLICDEPTTALDVTTQAEILALINQLKHEHGMAVLFITHDMAVVAQMADRVVVMYRGEKVEEGPVDQIFTAPQEEYTRALLAAVPRLGQMRGTHSPALMPIAGKEVLPKPPANQPIAKPLLEVRNLITRFPIRSGLLRRVKAQVHAVEDVSFTVNAGETLSIVGESGSGKSTVGRSILRLVEPQSGIVKLAGEDVLGLQRAPLRELRRQMQMIFQDPFASLDPQMRLFDQISEPLENFGIGNRSEREDRIAGLFDRVELPRSFMRRYPHELSGGQRQRVAIARALAPAPKLIIADEAVSALDVTVQAQVLNLLMELQADMGLSMLFISHDMAVVERVSHHVAVMYLGRIVEIGPRAAVFENPQHPYTKRLLAAVPMPDPALRPQNDASYRQIPSPIHPIGAKIPPSVYREISKGHLVLQDLVL